MNTAKWLKSQLTLSLLMMAVLVISIIFSPRPIGESSVYRLLDEPLRSTQLFKLFLDEFPSDSGKLSSIIELRNDQNLEDLKKALDLLVQQDQDIWEQRSLFELRDMESLPAEYQILYPRLGDHLDTLEQRVSRIPLASFFYNSEKKLAYVEWTINPDLSALDVKVAKNVIESIRQNLLKSLGPQTDIKFGGPYFLEYNFQVGLKQNLILGAGSAIVLTFFIYLVFPKIKWVFLVLGAILIVQQFLASGMGWAGHKLSPLSSCLFLMMTVAIVEDFIFLFYIKLKTKNTFQQSAKLIRRASLLTSLTTAVGFGSLILTDSPKVEQFAVWAVVGTLLEWFLTIIICPVILDKMDSSEAVPSRILTGLDYLVGKTNKFFDAIVKNRRKQAIGLLILSFACALYSISNIRVGYDVFETFSRNNAVGQFVDRMREMNNVAGEISLFFPKKIEQSRMEVIRKNLKEQHSWQVLGYRDFLPANLSSFNPEIRKMTERLFSHSDELKPYMSSVAERIRIFLPEADSVYLEQVEKEVAEICKGDCYAVGEILVLNELSLSFLEKLYKSLEGSFLLVGLILFLVAYRVEKLKTLAILASSLWGPLIFLALVSLLGLTINVTICLCITVFVGLAGDSSLQFLFSKRNQSSFNQSVNFLAPASALTFIFMSISSFVFAFSNFAITQRLAWLFPMGFLVLYIGDVLILKLLSPEKRS